MNEGDENLTLDSQHKNSDSLCGKQRSFVTGNLSHPSQCDTARQSHSPGYLTDRGNSSHT